LIITVTGGSSTGKSAMAESIAMKLQPGSKLYIATMVRASSDEDPIIARHRKLREGKNFTTLECGVSPEKEDIAPGTTALLECVANLLTNEMFGTEGTMSEGLTISESGSFKGEAIDTMEGEAAGSIKGESLNCSEMIASSASDRVIFSIRQLADKCENLILVTNEVFSDGIQYDEAVMEYIRELGRVNRALMELSDVYVECVYGIPYLYKMAENCDYLFDA